jgi:hypothetical protein
MKKGFHGSPFFVFAHQAQARQLRLAVPLKT